MLPKGEKGLFTVFMVNYFLQIVRTMPLIDGAFCSICSNAQEKKQLFWSARKQADINGGDSWLTAATLSIVWLIITWASVFLSMWSIDFLIISLEPSLFSSRSQRFYLASKIEMTLSGQSRGGGVGCWAQWSTTGEKKSVEKRARSGVVPYKLLSAAL